MLYFKIAWSYWRRKEYDGALWAVREYLLSAGFEEVNLNAEPVVLRFGKNHLPYLNVAIVQFAAAVKTKRGETEAADKLTKFAKTLYLTLNGAMSGYTDFTRVNS